MVKISDQSHRGTVIAPGGMPSHMPPSRLKNFLSVQIKNGIGVLGIDSPLAAQFLGFLNSGSARIAQLPNSNMGQVPFEIILRKSHEYQVSIRVAAPKLGIIMIFNQERLVEYLVSPSVLELEGENSEFLWTLLRSKNEVVKPVYLPVTLEKVGFSSLISDPSRRFRLDIEAYDEFAGRVDVVDYDAGKKYPFVYSPRVEDAGVGMKNVGQAMRSIDDLRLSLDIVNQVYDAQNLEQLCSILLQIVDRVSFYEAEIRDGEYRPKRIVHKQHDGRVQESIWDGNTPTTPREEDPFHERRLLMHKVLNDRVDIEVVDRESEASRMLGQDQGSIILCSKFNTSRAWVLLMECNMASTLQALRRNGLASAFTNAIQKMVHLEYLETLRRQKVAEQLSMANLAEFLHDLKNSVVSIGAAIKIVQAKYGKSFDEQTKRVVKTGAKDLGAVDRLLNQAVKIDFLRQQLMIDLGSIQVCDVLAMLKEDAAALAQLRSKEILFQIESNVTKNTRIETDKDKLSRILRNLVNNAFKYGEQAVLIRITANNDTANLVISIQDYGPPLHYRESSAGDWEIFDGEITGDFERKFLYTSFEPGGDKKKPHFSTASGVGLPSVIRQARAINARVFVKNLSYGGKTISLELPFTYD